MILFYGKNVLGTNYMTIKVLHLLQVDFYQISLHFKNAKLRLHKQANSQNRIMWHGRTFVYDAFVLFVIVVEGSETNHGFLHLYTVVYSICSHTSMGC